VWRRVTTRPVRLAGAPLPRGARLFLWLAAANRDASVFPDPERFDLHRRNADQPLAFGRGLHDCLGATSARSRPGSCSTSSPAASLACGWSPASG
jgi:cytochrome P450